MKTLLLLLFTTSAFLLVTADSCYAQGFPSTMTQWSTPFGYEATAGNNSTWKWTTMDINGDGLPDMVDTYFNTVYGTAGNNYWEVYLNTGSGFAPTVTQWSTPFGYEHTAGNNSTWKWTTMDMNGDGLPDLVDTYFNTVYGTPGNNYWEVYLNTGSGFSSTATQWSTPFGYEATAGNNSTWKYTTMDINGDGLPDMVDTYFNGVYGTAGNNYWEVYLNTGSGFSSTATQWSTPFGYEATAGNNATWKYTTMDINGDGLPDMVDTYFNTVYGTPGNNYWEVYLNTGSGFSSTVTQWSTPFGYEATAGNNATWKYTTMDINGDGRPDMVDTYFNGVYGSAGNNYWEVWVNNGSGFESTVTYWSTPYGYEATAGNNATWKYTTMDMNGDGFPDMVDTYFNTVYGTPGNNYWEVYLNTGSGTNSIEESDVLFAIHPNPTNGNITINVDADYTLEVVDMVGQTIFEESISSGKNNFDLSSYPNGVYIVTIRTEKNVYSKRLILNK